MAEVKPNTHLTLDGEWATCADDSCSLPFHVELSLEEASRIPGQILEQLIEPFDPPTTRLANGSRRWDDEQRKAHRDYDLPAIILATGRREWHRHGELHREGGKPAIIYGHGVMEWWENGKFLRSSAHTANSVRDEGWNLPKSTLARLLQLGR